ncbi:MAG: metal ABC transporter permease [Alphaproteobacteria bacterium]|nr:metal ABC transporter permease [Alphaproteobacteria bacterium]
MDDLILRAIFAAIGIGLLAGMLGSFIIWRRMSYMGDAMGHASLMGVVLGLLLGVLPFYTILAVATFIGLLLSQLQKDKRLPFDALLGVVSTGGLAVGLLVYGAMPTRQVDLYGYLFGDILAVNSQQLLLIYGALIVQGILIYSQWRALLRMIIHEDIARIEQVPVGKLQIMLTICIAVTVALALQIVGMLLITAMLVIPPLAARPLSGNPQQMVIGSMALAVIAAIGGVVLSYHYNLSTGPSIVLVAIALFVMTLMSAKLLKRQH